MALSTHSIFYYGHEVTSSNNTISFNEGAGTLLAEMQVGNYTFTEFLSELKIALDAAGGLTYTVTGSRDTRLITIASTSTFELTVTDGRLLWDLIGFSGSNKTGASTYTGSAASGEQYKPQFIIQDYTDSANFQESVDSTVLEAASGNQEIVTFGTRSLFEMSFKFITNSNPDGVLIKNDPSGVANTRAFLQYITQKKPIEFMPSISSRSTYYKLVLEKTPTDSKGTGYKLTEMVDKGLPGFYEINNLVFRDLT